MKKNPKTQDQFKTYERNGQLIFAIKSEILLPENAPVRLTSAQLEELDYRNLYSAYSPRGRKSKVDSRVMFKVMVYGYQCGIYSSRKLEEACKYRIDFKWLLEDREEPDHSSFTCAEGRKLPIRWEASDLVDGHFVTTAYYRCESCRDCPPAQYLLSGEGSGKAQRGHAEKDLFGKTSRISEEYYD